MPSLDIEIVTKKEPRYPSRQGLYAAIIKQISTLVERSFSVTRNYITDEEMSETEFWFLVSSFPLMILLVIDAVNRWIQLDAMLR